MTAATAFKRRPLMMSPSVPYTSLQRCFLAPEHSSIVGDDDLYSQRRRGGASWKEIHCAGGWVVFVMTRELPEHDVLCWSG